MTSKYVVRNDGTGYVPCEMVPSFADDASIDDYEPVPIGPTFPTRNEAEAFVNGYQRGPEDER